MPRVELLVGEKDGRFPGSNCLYVKGVKSRILVDAGCRREQVLTAKDKVDAVVYTHIHPDHITHHHLLAGRPAYLPVTDAKFESLELLALRYAPEIPEAWLDYVKNVFGLESVPHASKVYESWETFTIGDLSIEAIPARGHTRGHHILVIGEHVHLADIDLTSFGPWYGHPESSLETFISDIKLASSLDGKTYTTSHREKIFDKREVFSQLERYTAALERQIRSVVNALSQHDRVTPGELADMKIIYRRYIPGLETVMNYFERNMIEKILDHQTVHGMVSKDRRGYTLKRA